MPHTKSVADFTFIPIPNFPNWVINAPKRSHRPRIESGQKCVFCPGGTHHEPELFRIPALDSVNSKNQEEEWRVRVLLNKYPFANIHELVILTPKHVKYLSELSVGQVQLGVEAYVNRYNAHKTHGTVCIFGNSGHDAGESIGHPHAQIVVIDKKIPIEVPRLEKELTYRGETFSVGEFDLICPPYSQWPDEVWIVPKNRGNSFGDISYKEIESLSYIWQRLVTIMELRHGKKFPHNFYIYPNEDWYVRILPRAKILGGFEIATGIFVNTQDPVDTMQFIKQHFVEHDTAKIKKNKAEYRRGV